MIILSLVMTTHESDNKGLENDHDDDYDNYDHVNDDQGAEHPVRALELGPRI